MSHFRDPVKPLDSNHPTVGLLRCLLPEAIVRGGSFSHWLPNPNVLPPSLREKYFRKVRSVASSMCVAELVRAVGLPSATAVPTLDTGERQWPPGYVGSLTNKGTVVLGAIAPVDKLLALGIDLERHDNDTGLSIAVIAPEWADVVHSVLFDPVVAFSGKEAVFKAQFPLTKQKLAFSDILLSRDYLQGPQNVVTARVGNTDFELRFQSEGKWLLCTAILHSTFSK